jgi:hypothetical protein
MKTYTIVSAMAIISLMIAIFIRGIELDTITARIWTLEKQVKALEQRENDSVHVFRSLFEKHE